MGKFSGLVLLELGTSVGSVDIVRYAKSQGAYVIVTDYLLPEKSEAKRWADETAMISTTDVDTLVQFAKDKHVNGVFCGVSEVNLVSVCKIAEALSLPCYFTIDQWEKLENKSNFNKLCREFNIPVAKKYELNYPIENCKQELCDIEYPVIVKPVDRSAAIGIHICYCEEELIAAYQDAYEKSFVHEVIVEDYIVGDEFSAAYTFIDGNFALSSMGDKYLNRDQTGFIPLPEAYVYPSKNLCYFNKHVNNNIINMMKSIGLKNGTAFFQGVTDGKKIALFEAGLRMGGTALYRFIRQINGINILELLVDYAMTGKIEADISLEDASFKGKRTCLLSLLNSGGVIGSIEGVELASAIEGVVETVVRYREGDTIKKSGTLKQSHIRFFVIRNSAEDLAKTISKIQEYVKVYDIDGNNMLLSKFETSKLLY